MSGKSKKSEEETLRGSSLILTQSPVNHHH
jgi:hypothetical protein